MIKLELEKLLPKVLNGNLNYTIFDPINVFDSLIKETDISEDKCKEVVEKTTRYFISTKIKVVTSPMIREVVNTMLLQLGLEKIRLQYTRIGLPFYDLKEIIENCIHTKDIIYNHTSEEYRNVIDLINILNKNGENNDKTS